MNKRQEERTRSRSPVRGEQDDVPPKRRSRLNEPQNFSEPLASAEPPADTAAAAAAFLAVSAPIEPVRPGYQVNETQIQSAMAQIAMHQNATLATEACTAACTGSCAPSHMGTAGAMQSAASPMLPTAPAGKILGTVKIFNMDKGYGFIALDTGGEDLFVHAAQLLDGNALMGGARVCFKASYDHQKNKPVAQEVTGGYVDPRRPPPVLPIVMPQAVPSVRSPSMQSLMAPSMPAVAPTFPPTQMPALAAPPPPAAVGPMVAPPAGAAAAVLANGMAAGGMGFPSAMQPVGPVGPPPNEPPPPPGKVVGTVKVFNMDKGYGFIAPDGGGEDLFVHAAKLTDGNALTAGARVSFKPSYDQQKNKPIAEEVSGGYIDPRRPPPSANVLNALGIQPTAPAPTSFNPNDPPLPAGKQWGTVKAFNMGKGFGFIAPDSAGEDLFVHAAKLVEGNALSVGARVSFKPSYDHQKMKPIAEDVTGGYLDPRRPPPVNGSGMAVAGAESFAPPPVYQQSSMSMPAMQPGITSMYAGQPAPQMYAGMYSQHMVDPAQAMSTQAMQSMYGQQMGQQAMAPESMAMENVCGYQMGFGGMGGRV
uniref:CSD domain-containing protein n=1 Tax=Haptolina brevifila TaxID=156173 RepID=A0A7S2C1A5_9EUKA|mmetsp:Transcript_18620/g.37719  ORF Transcript_18620/g.37719 Transcript_18620/m.37719 type:complete len:591 (+) Transcript_18620:59-1831(+)|eukprot:CAMPEP_0174725078 /NCGR_PEP_ID=MMETSP1094-20130205/44758_1 /TAXON_ID=156173 /ORGANISM="Chrysochromulina brevifilum, Strain UTEX LB 985" /LENGTH=590 /DNA_ID=CAMNT_0015926405 /DNA_START=65 /DNA_END=1837 /DNA_ORIENTATION=+